MSSCNVRWTKLFLCFARILLATTIYVVGDEDFLSDSFRVHPKMLLTKLDKPDDSDEKMPSLDGGCCGARPDCGRYCAGNPTGRAMGCSPG